MGSQSTNPGLCFEALVTFLWSVVYSVLHYLTLCVMTCSVTHLSITSLLFLSLLSLDVLNLPGVDSHGSHNFPPPTSAWPELTLNHQGYHKSAQDGVVLNLFLSTYIKSGRTGRCRFKFQSHRRILWSLGVVWSELYWFLAVTRRVYLKYTNKNMSSDAFTLV